MGAQAVMHAYTLDQVLRNSEVYGEVVYINTQTAW